MFLRIVMQAKTCINPAQMKIFLKDLKRSFCCDILPRGYFLKGMHFVTSKKLLDKKYIYALVFLCAAIYFVSYVTRINYSAVLVEIQKSEDYSKTVASVPLTGLFVVYGIGQLISGFLGDKFSPEKIIFCGLITTSTMNILLPFSIASPVLMTVVWSINGFAQALMWPPIVKILARYLRLEDYSLNIVYIIMGGSLGTIFVYAMSPVVIALSSWKYVFFSAAVIAGIISAIWIVLVFRLEKHAVEIEVDVPLTKTEKTGEAIPFTKAAVILLSLIMVANIFQGLLRDGITTWMPTYMADTFKFGSGSAILTSVALPIAQIAVSFFTATIYRKILKNEAKCTTLFFVICTVCCAVLCISQSSSPVLSTAMLMVASAATHAINFMYTSISVAKFERFNKTGFVTGAINSSVYIGSAVSTYGIAAITTRFGWSGTMTAWLMCSVAGLVVAMVSIRPFGKQL